MDTNIHFVHEDGGSMPLRNVGTNLHGVATEMKTSANVTSVFLEAEIELNRLS